MHVNLNGLNRKEKAIYDFIVLNGISWGLDFYSYMGGYKLIIKINSFMEEIYFKMNG